MSVRESWSRIVAWSSANMPSGTFRPMPGATERQIADLEELVGIQLPEDVRESYRIHNGTDETVFPCYWGDGHLLPHEYGELVSLEFMEIMYKYHCEFEKANTWPEIITPEIKPVFWSSRRLVLTNDASDSGLRVDLDPAEAGKIGQIIRHDRSFGPVKVIAPSWAELLQRISPTMWMRASFTIPRIILGAGKIRRADSLQSAGPSRRPVKKTKIFCNRSVPRLAQ
jgi:cell wall assembly regulator SMI1